MSRRSAVHAGFEEHVVAPVLVHQRRPGRARRQHVHDRGQLLESSSTAAARSSASARVAATHTAIGSPTWRTLSCASTGWSEGLKPGKSADGDDRLDADEIGGDEHAVFLSCGLTDIQNSCVRQRTAHERHFQHAGERDVADELAPAAHVTVVFLAAH